MLDYALFCMLIVPSFNFFYLLQAGQFIIEYCGEVISWKEAKRRSQAYETQGQMLISYMFAFDNQFHCF